jgi:glycosyltransferase involved in cell wall biosynthesis
MKVLFLTNNPNLGSTARILQHWLLLGRQEGLQGFVVARTPGDLVAWLASNGVPHFVNLMPWPSRGWPFPSLWHAWKVARWARRAGVEIIHCNEHDVYPFALLLRRLLRLPAVCHVRFRLERAFAEWAFREGRCPEALLWTSCQQRDDCACAVKGLVPVARQHVVPLGIDLQTFGTIGAARAETRHKWGVGPQEVVVGTASALRPRKRIEDFVELVAKLAHQDSRVVGALAGDAVPGDESYRDQVLRQIEETALGRRFKWLGNLEPIEPFYHAIDVFVSTSEYETFGNSVCEAMACSRPVAAYSGGSVHEVVGSAGFIVSTADLSALTARVTELVRDQQLRVEFGARGRQRVADTFTPVKSLEQLKRIYLSLLPERGNQS